MQHVSQSHHAHELPWLCHCPVCMRVGAQQVARLGCIHECLRALICYEFVHRALMCYEFVHKALMCYGCVHTQPHRALICLSLHTHNTHTAPRETTPALEPGGCMKDLKRLVRDHTACTQCHANGNAEEGKVRTSRPFSPDECQRRWSVSACRADGRRLRSVDEHTSLKTYPDLNLILPISPNSAHVSHRPVLARHP